ncbi:hypothetical protein G3M54_01220 [Bacillus megaterium NBRC 15308 = ATCC 14581]|nr:hypothetical protein [Priestia megaterium NBRC 15308 = ATCC 14581]
MKEETWTKVIALGAGEGKNQLKVIVGTGDAVKVFTDKEIKTTQELTTFANSKLEEGNVEDYVTYKAKVLSLFLA